MDKRDSNVWCDLKESDFTALCDDIRLFNHGDIWNENTPPYYGHMSVGDVMVDISLNFDSQSYVDLRAFIPHDSRYNGDLQDMSPKKYPYDFLYEFAPVLPGEKILELSCEDFKKLVQDSIEKSSLPAIKHYSKQNTGFWKKVDKLMNKAEELKKSICR